uniref:DUF19 domain-containing protein n=1 Tax=Caenorhabditis tropicalis TaxID=1561998 RepID=A0A1I7V296_9PELO
MILFLILSLIISVRGSEKMDCDSEQAVLKMLNCTSTLLEMIEFSGEHPKDHDQMKVYLEDCELFLSCDQSYKCLNNPKYAGDIKKHHAKCIANIPILTEFRDCEVKLRDHNSTCYQEYNPFSEDEMIQRMVKLEKEACGKLFGEDDCMIKETMETCGKNKDTDIRRS